MDVFSLYYWVALMLMLVLLWSYRKNMFAILIILMAFAGVFDFFIPRGTQLLNIVTVLLTTYLIMTNKVWEEFRHIRYLMIAFGVFSIYFITDNLLVHVDDILFVFSQYSKYYVPFTCLLLFIHYGRKGITYLHYFNRLIGLILLIQVFMSAYKFFLFKGHYWEGMVGTFGGIYGGGTGTGLPLVALCWVAINSNMDIRKWKSWLFVAGLLLLGIAAGKRAVIFLFPILLIVLSIFVCKNRYSKRIWLIFAVVPLFFYLGARLTPSFNPENKVWGSFNLAYVLDYTEKYSTGHVEDGDTYKGRVGSAWSFWNILKDTDNMSIDKFLGEGVQRAYTSAEDRDAYNKFGQDYGLNSRGDITGILMLYIAIGVVGVVLLIIYYVFLFRIVQYKRLRWVLFLLVMFDFIFYNSTIIRNPFVSTLMMFVIVYSLVQYSSKGNYSMVNHSFFAK